MVDEMKRAERLSRYADKDLTDKEIKIKGDYIRKTYKEINRNVEYNDDPQEVIRNTQPQKQSLGEKIKRVFIRSEEDQAERDALKAEKKKAYKESYRETIIKKEKEKGSRRATYDVGGGFLGSIKGSIKSRNWGAVGTQKKQGKSKDPFRDVWSGNEKRKPQTFNPWSDILGNNKPAKKKKKGKKPRDPLDMLY